MIFFDYSKFKAIDGLLFAWASKLADTFWRIWACVKAAASDATSVSWIVDKDDAMFWYLTSKLDNVDSSLFWYAPIFDLELDTFLIALSISSMNAFAPFDVWKAVFT